MENFSFVDERAEITKRDVRELKKNLKVGDTVWVEIEMESFENGNLHKKVALKKKER